MHLALIVSTYNNADSISKCLKSVISFKKKLTKFDIKIILVDDGSTDETPSILTKFCYKLPSAELKKFEKNQGVSRSRNYGISKSLNSDYILFLDGDDEIDINFSEYLNKIDAIKILKGQFCSNISQKSPIEDKEIIVGKEGNESIPINIHKSLHYPTYFSKQITNIETIKNEYYTETYLKFTYTYGAI